MIAGFLLLSLGLFLLAVPAPGEQPFVWLGLSALICGVGIGTAGPPSNNAAIRLMPDQVAAISGLRAMFRMTGGILAITITAAVIGTGANEAEALGHAFAVFGAIAILVAPAVLAVPEPNPARRSRTSPARDDHSRAGRWCTTRPVGVGEVGHWRTNRLLHRYSAAPPSTVIMDPVTMAASSETANRQTRATSSAVCSRPRGVESTRRA